MGQFRPVGIAHLHVGDSKVELSGESKVGYLGWTVSLVNDLRGGELR